MTPVKAFAWTLAYVLAGSFAFWNASSRFVEAPYRHWLIDLVFLCLFVPLSWLVYRDYRKGAKRSFWAKLPISEQRGLALFGCVFTICAAVLLIVLARLGSRDHMLDDFAVASFWLVLGADSFRRYLELKRTGLSKSH